MLRKDNFLKGTFIATFYIVLGKIIGIIYAIPFHAIIGEKGGALYSYAYSTYDIFLTLSTIGIPLAVSKIVSEYSALGFLKAQSRVLNLAKILTVSTAFLCTITLFICAPFISYCMIKDVKGGNTQESVTFVIRVSSTALLFVAMIGSMRGYLQGNRYISVSCKSQVLEQITRISFVILGSYIVNNLLNLGITQAVGTAVFGATVGAIISALYLKSKISKESAFEPEKYKLSDEEKSITNKFLIKKLIFTGLPFIVINIVDSSYSLVNSLTVVTTLNEKCGFSGEDAESVFGIITTWGLKLNSIVTSIAGGITISILPNLTRDLVSKNFHEIRDKINKTLQILAFTTIPMATGLSLLSRLVWISFYGKDSKFGSLVFGFSVFVAVFSSFELNVSIIVQSLNKFKMSYFAAISGLILNAVMNVPCMIIFGKLGLGAHNGPSFSTMLGLSLSAIINLIYLKKSYGISYKKTVREISICLASTFAMVLTIICIRSIMMVETGDRFISILLVGLYTVAGASVYFLITFKSGLVKRVFGSDILKKISPILGTNRQE
ncbi:MAG: polysaccharide biosynthesis protein [Oscillospiraceae bacterium]|nr:polysaccharide biosynthesis protein [Oscillospiraceae bacterium]